MKLLVITHAFPPSRHANAKRPYYLVKGFLEAGWQVDVFTLHIAMPPGAAESIEHPRLHIFRRKDPIVALAGKCTGTSLLSRLGGRLIAAAVWPDQMSLWALRTVRACRHAGPYDRVLAFVYPPSVLLSGLPRALVGPRWTFDFQESVTPQFRRYRRSPLQRLLLPPLAWLERRTLHKAGLAVFTADTNRQTYVREGLVPEGKTAHVPYFFDAEVFRKPAPAPLPEFAIVYFGTFDWSGARSPETFLHALRQFLDRRPEARPRTRFVFYGNWLFEHSRFVKQLGLEDIVSLCPSVGYEQYLQKVRQSSVLLLVVSSAHDLFMPSKIVEYFGAGRPILAFVPRESEMRHVLEQAGMAEFASDESDANAGAAALEQLWQRYQAGNLTSNTDKTRFWSSEVQIPRYLELVNRLGEQ